jgi:hypothetical protein
LSPENSKNGRRRRVSRIRAGQGTHTCGRRARNLLHLGGTINYEPNAITVTLDPPDSPRLTTALTALTDELNRTPPNLPGDPRPITYKINIQQ